MVHTRLCYRLTVHPQQVATTEHAMRVSSDVGLARNTPLVPIPAGRHVRAVVWFALPRLTRLLAGAGASAGVLGWCVRHIPILPRATLAAYGHGA